MIVLNQVSKVFNKGRQNEFVSLREISIMIPRQQVTVLKGPSGSGKTTLLSIIGGMSRPTSGRVTLDGRETTSLPERFLAALRRETFGFIFQQFNLINGISILENVMLPAVPNGERHATLKGRALELLAMFGLEARAATRVELLSGGEMQRVAIARALINNPRVIIADEPTAHLDSKLSGELITIMERLKQEGRTIIMASHDPLVCNAGVVDNLVEIRDGEIRDSAPAQ
ncbi:MAG: ABC transporter ATP-binding protein [Geobacteraceae bacterium GWF2_54_21]|nr:MAG: ABC transporter ATP-binding protein [Geobacteraceae bacterium GWF2_54_21]